MSGPSFYSNVVPLNRERHRKIKLRADGLMRFAASTHFVPIAAAEFYEAAREYPIVFAGSDDATPLAILGLRDGENLYVDDEGRWAAGAYVPAFVRRYPFILARTGQEQSNYTVCLDEGYEGLSETDGTPLFDDEGKESELVSRVTGLLGDFLTETERTRRFVERLGALELLTVQSMQVQDGAGRVYALRDFRMVDEPKLRALDDATLGELHRSGYLGCIYAHLVSLGNVPRLASRLPAEPTGTAADGVQSGDAPQGRARG
jgi:hypothetical protein